MANKTYPRDGQEVFEGGNGLSPLQERAIISLLWDHLPKESRFKPESELVQTGWGTASKWGLLARIARIMRNDHLETTLPEQDRETAKVETEAYLLREFDALAQERRGF